MRQSYFLQTNLISHADLNVALSWKTTSLLNKALLFDILKKTIQQRGNGRLLLQSI